MADVRGAEHPDAATGASRSTASSNVSSSCRRTSTTRCSSCGRFLAAHPGATVVTVFAGNPPAYPNPMRTVGRAGSGFAPGDDVMERVAERGRRRARRSSGASPCTSSSSSTRTTRATTPVPPDVIVDAAGARARRARADAGARALRPRQSRSRRHPPRVHARARPPRDDVSWWCYEDNGYKHIPGMLAWRGLDAVPPRAVADARVPARSIPSEARKRAAIACYPTQLLALEDDWQIERQARCTRARAVLAPRATARWLGTLADAELPQHIAPAAVRRPGRRPRRLDAAAQRDARGRRARARRRADEQRAAVGAAERARERAAAGRDLVERARRLRRRARTGRLPGTRPRSRLRRRGRCRPASRRSRAADAHTRRFDSVPSSAMSNAVSRAAVLSPTISVRPSGVIDRAVREARGRRRRPTRGRRARPRAGSSCATARRRTCRSRSCRRTRARARRRPCRCSSPARASRGRRAPTSVPSVEAQHPPVEHRHDEHATVGEPAEPDRLVRDLDDGLRGAVGVDRDDAAVVLSEKHSRPSCQRGPSGNARPSSSDVRCSARVGTVLVGAFGRTDLVERLRRAVSGSRGTKKIAAISAAMPQSAIDAPDARRADPTACPRSRGRATIRGRPISQQRVRRAAHSRWGTARRRACRARCRRRPT